MIRPGQAIILIAIALLVIGVLMVNSASLEASSASRISLGGILMGRDAIMAGAALVAMVVGCLVPVRMLASTSRLNTAFMVMIILVVFACLLMVHVPGIGREINGARRWIQFGGGIGFQPSEIAKWGVLIVLAWYACAFRKSLGRFFTGFGPPIMLIGVMCALIGLEDLGTAVLIFGVSLLMLLAAGARILHVLALVPLGVVGIIAAILQSPYRVNRILAYLDPYSDSEGIGYHIIQSMGAIAGGGLAGRGLGNSIQKFGYLPESTTDFIFAIICEELGIIGACIIILMYIVLLFSGLRIIMNVRNDDIVEDSGALTDRSPVAVSGFLRLLALGILLMVGCQAFMNIAVVTGIAPTKGIALPLLSRGGTGWILTAFCLGLLASIDRWNTLLMPSESFQESVDPDCSMVPVAEPT